MPPVIDAHHSFWDPATRDYPWLTGDLAPLRRRYGPAELAPELAGGRITGTLLVQTLPQADESAELLSMAAAVPFVQGVVGWVDIAAPDVAEQVTRLRAGPGGELLVGVRTRALDELDPGWLGRVEVRRGLRALGRAGLVCDLHLRARELPAALETCAALPEVTFVLDHLAAPPIASGDLTAWGRALLPLGELPNVSAKLSGLVTEADWHTWSIDDLRHPVELAVDAFGPHRLMLGSDWPTCLLAGGYSDAIDAVRYLLAELPEHEQDEIRGGTAVRLYGLPGDDRA
jgi:L-fuconolactonase